MMARRRSWSLVAALLVGAMTRPVDASSGEAPRQAADAEFRAGNQTRATNPAAACAHYRKSMDLEPNATVLVRIAECYEQESSFRHALAAYARARALNAVQNESRPEHRESLARKIDELTSALEARVSRITISVTPRPPGLDLQLDGEALAVEELDAPVVVAPAKSHRLSARAPGYQEASTEGTSELHLTLTPASQAKHTETDQGVVAAPGVPPRTQPQPSAKPPAVPATKPARPARPSLGEPASAQRITGFAVGTAGLVTLGFAAYFGLHTLALVDEADPYCFADGCEEPGFRKLEQATRAQTTGLALTAVGVVGVGVGATLLLTSPTRRPPTGSSGRFELAISLTGVATRGRW